MPVKAAIKSAINKEEQMHVCNMATLYGKSKIATINVNPYRAIKNRAPMRAKIRFVFFIIKILSIIRFCVYMCVPT